MPESLNIIFLEEYAIQTGGQIFTSGPSVAQISANFREMRHIFEVRCDKHAQWEIRAAAKEMLRILNIEAPAIFEDLAEKFLD